MQAYRGGIIGVRRDKSKISQCGSKFIAHICWYCPPSTQKHSLSWYTAGNSGIHHGCTTISNADNGQQTIIIAGGHNWVKKYTHYIAFTGQGIATAWCAICQIEGGSHTVDCSNFSSLVKRPYPGSQSPPNYTQSEPVKKRRKVPYCILYNRSFMGTCSYASTGISAATVDKSTLPRTALRRASIQLGKGVDSTDGHISQASPLVNW